MALLVRMQRQRSRGNPVVRQGLDEADDAPPNQQSPTNSRRSGLMDSSLNAATGSTMAYLRYASRADNLNHVKTGTRPWTLLHRQSARKMHAAPLTTFSLPKPSLDQQLHT